MSEKWQPGTVAMVTALNRKTPYRAYFDGEVWVECRSKYSKLINPVTIRPLIEIDPEDRKAVKRLLQILHGGVTGEKKWLCNNANDLAGALRTFARKPRLDEPMAFSAAVEDSDGVWWTRTGTGPRSGDWCNADGDHRDYADIDVVKVLGEGVQP